MEVGAHAFVIIRMTRRRHGNPVIPHRVVNPVFNPEMLPSAEIHQNLRQGVLVIVFIGKNGHRTGLKGVGRVGGPEVGALTDHRTETVTTNIALGAILKFEHDRRHIVVLVIVFRNGGSFVFTCKRRFPNECRRISATGHYTNFS